jgi:hypothetical protein
LDSVAKTIFNKRKGEEVTDADAILSLQWRIEQLVTSVTARAARALLDQMKVLVLIRLAEGNAKEYNT